MRSSLHEPERIPSIDRVTMRAPEQWFHPHHPDQRHREDGPAVVLHLPLMREEQWWLNGRLHRLTRFRLSGTVLCEQWWEGDRLHRTDGPTMIEYYPHGQVKRERWYLDGIKCSKEEHEARSPATSIERLDQIAAGPDKKLAELAEKSLKGKDFTGWVFKDSWL
jgi:hypothetical protein